MMNFWHIKPIKMKNNMDFHTTLEIPLLVRFLVLVFFLTDFCLKSYSTIFYDFFLECKAQTDILKSYYLRTHADEKLHHVTMRNMSALCHIFKACAQNLLYLLSK